MKYCINYYGKQIDLLNTIDEINIELEHITHLERDLQDFCELHKKQRINLIINTYDDGIDKGWIPYIFDFQQEHPEYNLYIRLPEKDEKYYSGLKEKYPNMKFFLGTFANNWEKLVGIINEGVSDVYVVEELGFALKYAAEVAHAKNVQIRVFPNVAQSSWDRDPRN